MFINDCMWRITYLKVVNDDRVGDAVDAEVLGHSAQTGAGHSDIDGELSGDRVEPEVQLGSDRQREITGQTRKPDN